jgi:hypothetical protein
MGQYLTQGKELIVNMITSMSEISMELNQKG